MYTNGVWKWRPKSPKILPSPTIDKSIWSSPLQYSCAFKNPQTWVLLVNHRRIGSLSPAWSAEIPACWLAQDAKSWPLKDQGLEAQEKAIHWATMAMNGNIRKYQSLVPSSRDAKLSWLYTFLSDKLKEMENSAIWAHSWRHFCLQELLPGQTTIDIHWYHWSLMPSSQKNPLHRTGIYDTMHMQHVLVIGVMIWEFLLPKVVWRNVPTAILAVCNSCWFLSFAVDLSLKVGEFHCKSQAHQPLYYLSMSIIFHLFPMISWCYYLLTSAYYILMLMPPAAKRLLGSGSSGSSDSSPLCSICWNCGWRMLKA